MLRVRTLHKRVLSVIFTAIVLVLAMSISAAAAEAPPENPVISYDQSLNLQNDGYLYYGSYKLNNNGTLVDFSDVSVFGGSYTFSGGVLTLTDVNFTTSAAIALDLTGYSSPLTLNINGANSFVSTYSGDNSTFGIDMLETLTITGNGNLTVASGDTTYGVSYGIRTYGDVIITGGTLTATGGAANVFSYGIYIGGYSINITGGAVTASGNTRALNIAPATLPAFYNWKTSEAGSLTISTTTALPSLGTYVYIESVTGATPATYAFNKAVSNGVFHIDYSLAPGVTFNNIVKNGTTALSSATEWWSVDDNTIEITSSYLMGLPVGTYTITLDTTADVDPTVTLTVTNIYDNRLALKSDGLYYGDNSAPLTNDNSILGGGSYTYNNDTKTLTLNGVNYTTSSTQTLYIADSITLTLIGDNSLISTNSLSSGIVSSNNLTIGGSGSLTLSDGEYGILSQAITITGGTINASGGVIGVLTDNGFYITGGSINATMYGTPKDAVGGNTVYKTTLTGLPASTAVSAFSKTFSITGVKTDADGKLYFYLPRAASNEAINLTVGGTTYYGIIPTGNEAKTVAMTPPEPQPEPTSERKPSRPSRNPSNPPKPQTYNLGDTQSFISQSGITSTVTVTQTGVEVEAGLNKSGSVNSEATAAAVKKAAEIARINGYKSITIEIPEGATGLSKSTVQKLVQAANGLEIVLALTSTIDGEEVGSISLPINAQTGQILTGLNFDTKNIQNVQNYIAKKWDTDILGSFETAQKGGWGDIATLSVSMDKLGFSAEDGTSLYAIIYDTKTGIMYQVPAVIEGGNVVIETKRTGVVTIVTERVK